MVSSKGKRLKEAVKIVDSHKEYKFDEALQLLEKYATGFKAKFDETVEVVFKLGVDPKHSDQMVRGVVEMPAGLGKEIKIAVFTTPEKVDQAKKANADMFGSDDLIEKVKGGEINFDVCIATPDFMGKMSVLGKILGPKGLMPNPKLGTVSNDIEGAVRKAKTGQVEYKLEKAGIVHVGIGKLSFKKDDIKNNIQAIYTAILNAKPAGAKGVYMKKMCLSTTMGLSIMLDLGTIIS